MVSPVGFGRPTPLMQAAGTSPGGGAAPAGSPPAAPPVAPPASGAAPVAPRAATIPEAMRFVENLWVAKLVTAKEGKSIDERKEHWYYPGLGAELASGFTSPSGALKKLKRAQSASQLAIAIENLNGMKTVPNNAITGNDIKRAAAKLDSTFLSASIRICLDNIANNADYRKAVDADYYEEQLYKMLTSPYRGGAERSSVVPAVIAALKSVRSGTTPEAAADILAKDPRFKLSATAPAAGAGAAPSGALAGYPAKAVDLARELVMLKAKEAGEALSEDEIKKRTESILRDGEYKDYAEYPSTLIKKLQDDVEAIKQKQAEGNKRASGYFVLSGAHTGGPNGEKTEAGEDRTGLAGLTVAAGAGFKLTEIFGVSGAFHYSGGGTDPLNGMPPRFHYFGGKNKTTGSGFAVDEAVVTAEIPLVKDKLSLDLKLGITDLDARDELSAGKVLALSGNTYSLAKYSPIYNSPLGLYFRLSGNVTPALTMYLSGAAGKLPEYKIDNAATAKPIAEANAAGEDVISKELRGGLQWAANPKKPKTGHLVALQGQFYNGEKTSYGIYGTAQVYLSPSWAVQGSARLYSLDDGEKSDAAGYAALMYNFSARTTLSAYTSYVSRTKNEKGATSGVAAIDASGEAVPNEGVMTDKSATSITQFGGEFVFAATDNLKFKAVLGALRTNPQSGSEENTSWRSFVSGGITFGF